MKRELTAIVSTLLMMAVLLAPFAGGVTTHAETYTTTTMPLTTTSTGWDCISTPPPTTTTSWVLTGPDGTAPTTTPTTTEPVPSLCGSALDLLSTAKIEVSDTMAILGSPAGGYWLSADCYSYDGGTVSIAPTVYAATNGVRHYLHFTMIANVPFSVELTCDDGDWDETSWFPAEAVNADNTIAKGAYVLSVDVGNMWELENPIREITVTLTAPGSVTVGHVALSDASVCAETAPRIQTTTRPTYWDETTLPTTTSTTWVLTGPDGTAPTTTITTGALATTTVPTAPPTSAPTTTTTQPTTNPTVGDALLPGDVDGDGFVSSSDARLILTHCLDGTWLVGDGDYNGDGAVTTHDVRVILSSLTA